MTSNAGGATPAPYSTISQKFQAIHDNATTYYAMLAQVRSEPIGRFHGMVATPRYATISGEENHLEPGVVLPPSATESLAPRDVSSPHDTSSSPLEAPDPLDPMLAWYREHGTSHAPILFWTHSSPRPARLNARLLARGVKPNWSPHWMWLDLTTPAPLSAPSRPSRAAIEIRPSTPADLRAHPDEQDHAHAALLETFSPSIVHLQALHGPQRIGRCLLHLTHAPHPVAGLFDMEVDPAFRKQGVGTALCAHAAEAARRTGARGVYLNATPEGQSLYARAGFASLGQGHSWCLAAGFGASEPPGPTLVRALEALILGEAEALDEGLEPAVLGRRTASGTTPLELVARAGQAGSARVLLERGVVPDVMSLWELGWRGEARAWVERMPGLVNAMGGEMGATPMHYAVERDDRDLAELVLSVREYDPDVRDDSFGGTAAGWAEFLGKPWLVALMVEREKGGAVREK